MGKLMGFNGGLMGLLWFTMVYYGLLGLIWFNMVYYGLLYGLMMG